MGGPALSESAERDERRREVETLLALDCPALSTAESPAGPWAELHGTGLLLSAPHAAEHLRDGVPKLPERSTAEVVTRLAARLGCSAMHTLPGQLGDPNWDAASPYLERAASWPEAPHAVLDVHGMLPRGVDICLGLGGDIPGTSWMWEVLVEECVLAGLRTSVNWPFRAGPRTMTSQLQARGIPAIQIECSVECFQEGDLGRASWSALWRASRRLNDLQPRR